MILYIAIQMLSLEIGSAIVDRSLIRPARGILLLASFFSYYIIALNPSNMRLYKIGFLLTGIIFSCNPKDKSVETSNDTSEKVMSTTLELDRGTRIKGPAGSLFVDDGGTGGIPVVF